MFDTIQFLDSKKIDHEHEIELYNIAKDITNIANGINHYNPESKYIHLLSCCLYNKDGTTTQSLMDGGDE